MALKIKATSMGAVLLALMVISIMMSSPFVYADTSNNTRYIVHIFSNFVILAIKLFPSVFNFIVAKK
jgi:hypothetical protein